MTLQGTTSCICIFILLGVHLQGRLLEEELQDQRCMRVEFCQVLPSSLSAFPPAVSESSCLSQPHQQNALSRCLICASVIGDEFCVSVLTFISLIMSGWFFIYFRAIYFGCAARLVGSQFPDQGLTLGPVSESAES